MTDTDKLEMKQIVLEALEPLRERIEYLGQENRSIYQAMFGIRGSAGLESDVKTLRDEVERLKIFRTRVITIVAAVQALMLLLVQFIISWFKSKSGGG